MRGEPAPGRPGERGAALLTVLLLVAVIAVMAATALERLRVLNHVERMLCGRGAIEQSNVEALIGVFDKIGVKTGIDFFDIADAAEEVVAPAMPAECLLDRNALIMGYSGVYSSFLKHAEGHAERYGVSAADILLEAGNRKLVGGQEDQLIDIALELKKKIDANAGV